MTETAENIKHLFNNIQLEIKNKFRLPIVIAYLTVLIIYNWDILYYIAFQQDTAIDKINFVKKNYKFQYYSRIIIPLLISILYSILFPIVQVILNIVLQYLKKINNKITRIEELDQAKHNFSVQLQLAGQQTIQQLQNRIDQLIIENNTLIEANNSLINQFKDDNDLISLESIYNNEYNKVSTDLKKEIDTLSINKKTNMIEIINYIENYTGYFFVQTLNDYTTFPNFTKLNLEILKKYKIFDVINQGTHQEQYKMNLYGIKFINYFKTKYVK